MTSIIIKSFSDKIIPSNGAIIYDENIVNSQLEYDVKNIKEEIKYEELEFDGILDYGLESKSENINPDDLQPIHNLQTLKLSNKSELSEDVDEDLHKVAEFTEHFDNKGSNSKSTIIKNKRPKKLPLSSNNFSCSLCSFRSLHKASINQHVNRIHLKLKPFACNECSFKTSYKGSLDVHIDKVHLNIRKFKCIYCEYGTSVKSHLKLHIVNVHYKIKPLKCSLCELRTDSKRELRIHIEKVHSTSFKCKECNFKTNLRKELKIHQFEHSDLKTFSCLQCDYITGRNYNLTLHVASVHEKLNLFKCSNCSYKTSRKDSLLRHNKNHLNDELPQYKILPENFKNNYSGISIKKYLENIREKYVDKCPV